MATRHGDLIWPVNAPFVVRMVTAGEERIPHGAYRIVLLIEGSARVESEFGEITLRPGTAAVISADDPDSFVEADGLVAVVQSRPSRCRGAVGDPMSTDGAAEAA